MVDYLKELSELIANRKIIPFLGAGTSVNFSPDWNELVKDMSKMLELDRNEDVNKSDYYLSTAQTFENEFGRTRLCEFLKEQLSIDHFDDKKGDIDLTFLGNDFPVIYTTNFDNVFEKMMEKYNRQIQVIVSNEELSNSLPYSRKLIKFHGDYNHPEDLVFTRKDYLKRKKDLAGNWQNISLMADLLRGSLLFVGYSLSDPDLKYLLKELKGIISSAPFNSYMIAFENTPELQSTCNDYGVILVDPCKAFPNHKYEEAFSLYLHQLNEEAQRKAFANDTRNFFSGSIPRKTVSPKEIGTLTSNLKKSDFSNSMSEFEHLYSGPVIIPEDYYREVSRQITSLCEKVENCKDLMKISNYVSADYFERINNKYLLYTNMIDVLKAANTANISGSVDSLSRGPVLSWDVSDQSLMMVIIAITCRELLRDKKKISPYFPDYLENLSELSFPYYLLPLDLKRFVKVTMNTFFSQVTTTVENPVSRQYRLKRFKNKHPKGPTEEKVEVIRKLIWNYLGINLNK